MNGQHEIVTVDADNVDSHGFFCYKSKPKSTGYGNKLAWLRERFEEGLAIKMVYEGKRSVGFIEYMPGAYTWRVVDAPGYLVIHCLWVVGRAKGKGYGSFLLGQCIEDAQRQGKRGVVMVSSRGNWLAHAKVFVKSGFQGIDSAPPSFQLLVRQTVDGPLPTFPGNWDERLASFGPGVTVAYADQCPYTPDAVSQAVAAFAKRGLEARTVRFDDARDVREWSPSPYGVFAIVMDGDLFSYHYLGSKEIRRLDQMLR
jgi:ribosomal protein S18 acetylase RimI-like enzyme